MASLGSYKLSPAQHWDSDSNPYGFNDWIKEMSSLVRTLKKGDILENFLDEKLKRVAKHSSLMSKVLLDDEDFHNDAITAIIGEAEKSSTSILVTHEEDQGAHGLSLHDGRLDPVRLDAVFRRWA